MKRDEQKPKADFKPFTMEDVKRASSAQEAHYKETHKPSRRDRAKARPDKFGAIGQ